MSYLARRVHVTRSCPSNLPGTAPVATPDQIFFFAVISEATCG
jgi:hypothetical protein